ncbi:hypothetical protein KFK09_004511 [Dendrobium nobile]|uniref:Reverse transcriptase zinc-binding domain-containing protein n=1 Tax=Dendrobium nobile TaxID=94219 RepID=A0A8T3C4A7_DENNO|nr:hypothetical protein KFK09_004511 [Dendrobium nobile]
MESINHLFFECQYSFDVINHTIPDTKRLLLRPTILHLFEWIEEVYSNNALLKNLYLLFVSCSLYFIWKERNSRRFGYVFNNSSTTSTLIKSAVFVKVGKWKAVSSLLCSL